MGASGYLTQDIIKAAEASADIFGIRPGYSSKFGSTGCERYRRAATYDRFERIFRPSFYPVSYLTPRQTSGGPGQKDLDVDPSVSSPSSQGEHCPGPVVIVGADGREQDDLPHEADTSNQAGS